MGLSFLILLPCSVFAGYLFRELFIGLGSGFWNNSIFVNYENLMVFDAEFTPFYIKLIPLFFGLIGSVLSYILHKYLSVYIIVFLKEKGNGFFIFFNSKWLLDEFANKANYFFLKEGYQSTFKGLDRGYFEIIGPTGISSVVVNLSLKLKRLHSGYLYHYLGLMSLSLVFFLALLVFKLWASMLFVFLSIICINQILIGGRKDEGKD
jgi:NADH-ubiquinone oxidoreductase chain 5